MKNVKRITAVLTLCLALIISSLPFGVTAEATALLVYSTESNSGTRGVICTTLEGTSAESYYTGNYTYDKLDDLSGDALFDALQKLMTDTHTYLSTYDDCHYKADKTDCEENNGKVTLIYTSYRATMDQWNGWNREHVWPKSLGGGDDEDRTGGADLHHIRPSDAGVNSSRGNKKYGNSDGGKEKYGTKPAVGILGGTYSSTYFEPLDNVKGDVARICLYVYVRWNDDWGANSVTQVFESIDVLLEWCELDPVDTWEMGRNEVIGELQGNRNVFIDYPELAWLIFDREVPDGMPTPSGKASEGDPSCVHASTEVKNKKDADCGTDGYTGDTYCKTCGKKLSSGTVIKASGDHELGDWQTVGDKQTSVCTVCGKTEERPLPECAHGETEVTGAVEPTCGAEGYTGDTRCKECGTVIAEGASIPPTYDHKNTELRGATAPTCVTDGTEGNIYCTDCGCLVSYGAVILATGEHSLVEGEIISEPTKDKDGLRMDKCANCDYVEGVVLPATGDGDNSAIIAVAIAAAVAVGAAVVTVIVIRKKKVK